MIKSIGVELRFSNVQINKQKISEQQIDQFLQNYQDNKNEDISLDKIQYIVQETQLPQEARLNGKSLYLDIYSDITVVFKSWSQENLQGEVVQERKEKMTNQIVAQMPLMVGSDYCITNDKSLQQLRNLQECPLDKGAYFIIKGLEYSINFIESVKMNDLQLRNDQKKKEIRGFVISQAGDTYQHSLQMNIFYNYKFNNLTSNVEEYERLGEIQIPFYLIFKIFGITNDVKMLEMIVEDSINSSNNETRQLLNILQNCVDVEYPYFENATKLLTSEEILQRLCIILNDELPKKKALDSFIQYTIPRLRDVFQAYYLPHMGTTSLDNEVKMRYFGQLIKKVLIAYKDNTFPDKNTYCEKRIHTTGVNLAKKLKKTFNHQVITPLRGLIIKELKRSRNIFEIDIIQMISTQLNNNIVNKMIQKSIISSQNTSQNSADQSVKNRIQSQILLRKNIVNTISSMRVITNSKLSKDKQSKMIIQQRSVHPSFAGYICPLQSSDNGEKAGKLKTLSSLAVITNAMATDDIIEVLWEILEEYIYEIDQFEPKDMTLKGLKKIFINGFWQAVVQVFDVNKISQILKEFRRQNSNIWKHVTIYIDLNYNLYIYSDSGRLLNPLLIVHYDKQNKPYINLDEQKIEYILSGQADINWYLQQQILEYISVEESHNCLVGESIQQFYEKTQEQIYNNKETQYKFTHIILPQSLIGNVALLSSFGNHTQAKRITMFTNQAKQACGWATYNFPYRLDSSLLIQQYISTPQVRTIMNDFFPSNGQNIIVAYMVYDGFNQEDSVIFNKGSVDQGMFNAVYYSFEETQIKYNECPENITASQPDNYPFNCLKLKNGIIQKGIWIQKGDVLVAKKEHIRGQPSKNTSLVYKNDAKAFVENIFVYRDESQSGFVIKIKLKMIRNLKQGDKLAANQGCKSIISKLLLPSQLPYTEDGLIPDIIFNPHSIPTRGMVSQLLEGAYQRIALESCDTIDASIFAGLNPNDADQLMEKFNIKDKGYETMYNGNTGEMIQSKIYVTPNFYMRLQKFATTAKYVVEQSSMDQVTRQSLHSRKMNGGARLGEMELSTLYSSGTSFILKEKAFDGSDAYDMYFCKNCGSKAEFNKDYQYQIYNCSKCKDNVDIVKCDSTWSYNNFISHINSMNVQIDTIVEKPEMEIEQDSDYEY